jgi:hypothetical protein
MERSVLRCVCVCALVALPVGGCSDETAAAGGGGGSGGDGGTGGMGGDGGWAGGGEAGSGGSGGTGGIPENDLTNAGRAYCLKLAQCFVISAEGCIDDLRWIGPISDPISGCRAAFIDYFECIADQDLCNDLSACDVRVLNESCN